MDAQLARAVANALWPAWRRDRLRRHVCLRDMARSNPLGYSPLHSGTVAIAPAARTTVVTYEEEWLEAVLLTEEWPGVTCVACGGHGRVTEPIANVWDEPFDGPGACGECGGGGVVSVSYCLRLTRAAHDSAVFLMSSEERVALLAARRAGAHVPFEVTENRHGRRKLRRNSHDPLITPVAAAALEALARAVTLAPVSEATVDAFLLGDDDSPAGSA